MMGIREYTATEIKHIVDETTPWLHAYTEKFATTLPCNDLQKDFNELKEVYNLLNIYFVNCLNVGMGFGYEPRTVIEYYRSNIANFFVTHIMLNPKFLRKE